MSIFEIITLSLSLILGLGIAQLLSNAVDVFRNRELWDKHWGTNIWVFIIFLLQIQFLFSVHGLDSTREEWNTFDYLLTVWATILLFLSGALILPNKTVNKKASLEAYFNKNGKYGVLMISVYLFSCVLINILQGQKLLANANLFNFALAPVGILIFAIPNRKLIFTATLIFAVISIIAFFIGAWTFL